LTKDLHSLPEVIATLGEPDINDHTGVTVTTPERDGKPETTRVFRRMTYTSLSEMADVVITVYPPDTISIQFEGKAIKPQAQH
jgi:hypothetical protein